MKDNEIKLSDEDFGALAVFSIRYAQGRQTYVPDLLRGIIRPHLSKLSDKDLRVMINDCESQRKYGNWGNPNIDKAGWEKWEQELREEQARRREEPERT